MDCEVFGDLLSNDCRKYEETTPIKVAGQVLPPGTNEYPYIIPDNGDTILICKEEVEIPEFLQIPNWEYWATIWDFR